MKIAVALSGGVDSTAVALKLKQEGHDVIGLTMRLCPDVSDLPETNKSQLLARPGLAEHGCSQCIAPCACVDGRQSAKGLGIRHEILDFRDAFEKKVITPFVNAFVSGITPNPCALCNREMKFGMLLDTAKELGASHLATGHYARIGHDQDGAFAERANDLSKDQTYFMSLVSREKFNHVLFPLGDTTKKNVQQDMEAQGLQPKHNETSVEICFLRERAYSDFIHERIPNAFQSGDIVDMQGKVLGRHKGLPRYTIGQRKGLGVAARHPLYVVRLEAHANRVIVGEDKDLWSDQVTAQQVNWMMPLPADGLVVNTLIRYRQQPVIARVFEQADNKMLIKFNDPVRAITPGQVAAVYCNNKLLAGGLIVA